LFALALQRLVFGADAIAEGSLSLDGGLQSVAREAAETPTSMAWPMLPGESINDIARLFYPKNAAMQQRFTAKTLRLNVANLPDLKSNTRVEAPTLLTIPTLKSLSHVPQGTQEKSTRHRLQISYGIEKAAESVPEKLMQEYEFLFSKNEFLKQELARLKEKIIFLESKLDNLKLIFDKTLSQPNTDTAEKTLPTAEQSGKKVFKNLNKATTHVTQGNEPPAASPPRPGAQISPFNANLLKIFLALSLLAILANYIIKRYRERMFSKLSFVATKMQNTVSDFSAYIQAPSVQTEQKTPESAIEVQAAKEIAARLDATLQEAKLLMSINRATDAVAHLKLTIESQPKASINHWLYLLEIFRKLNLKEDFEQYAKALNETFNVMTPIWYDTQIAMVVPESLEEFPHIMEKLYSVWPGELATVYLRGLITDNRGGERTGFGKAVLGEILMLIELLDLRKDFN
jgi:hypothetical protein